MHKKPPQYINLKIGYRIIKKLYPIKNSSEKVIYGKNGSFIYRTVMVFIFISFTINLMNKRINIILSFMTIMVWENIHSSVFIV